MHARVALVVVMSALGLSCAPEHGARGPWLMDVTDDAITVVWETERDTDGTVRFGRAGAPLSRVARSPAGTHHEVRLDGLRALVPPGGEVAFRVEAGDRARSGVFNTAPVGDAPFSFVVYGDNRSARDQHEAVVDALLGETTPIHFAVHSGDFVSHGDSEEEWDEFFEVEEPFLLRTPLVTAIGNHEVVDGRYDIARRLFAPPTTQPPASDSEAYFHARYGNTELIVLNVEVDDLSTIEDGPQQRWLRETLDARPSGVRHRFVVIHQGPYSSKRGRDGNFWLRQWLDDFAAAGVEALFSGHDHYAERGFARNGIPYFIHGGGGAPLYETKGVRALDDHTIAFAETALGYMVVEVDGGSVAVTMRGLGGETLTHYAWGDTLRPACATALDCPIPEVTCDGARSACYARACRTICDALPTMTACTEDADCAGQPCEGTSRCGDEQLCRCEVRTECERASDCDGLAPPIPGCAGTWGCPDRVCEFTPDNGRCADP